MTTNNQQWSQSAGAQGAQAYDYLAQYNSPVPATQPVTQKASFDLKQLPVWTWVAAIVIVLAVVAGIFFVSATNSHASTPVAPASVNNGTPVSQPIPQQTQRLQPGSGPVVIIPPGQSASNPNAGQPVAPNGLPPVNPQTGADSPNS